MKVALITDTHFGHKNDSILFHDYFIRFYDEVFFPELRKRGVRTVIHLGDLFDRRKYINFHILHRTRIDFLQKLMDGEFDTHIIIGNHDTYFRDKNEVNSVTELLHMRYPNFHVYEEPQEITLDGTKIMIAPWLNPTNMANGLDMIANTKAKILMGHFEIAGFHMDQHQMSDSGLDKSLFAHFDAVFSGHFHHASQDGPVRYLGSPYEYTFADVNDAKGFYIFDTDTLEIEFVQNPFRMFYLLTYDDRDENKHEEILETDFSHYTDKYVRVVVLYKNNPVLYDRWMDNLIHANPADMQIKDNASLDVPEEVDDEIGQHIDIHGEVDPAQTHTLTIVNKYIDSMGMDIERDRLKEIFRELYTEATAGLVTV